LDEVGKAPMQCGFFLKVFQIWKSFPSLSKTDCISKQTNQLLPPLLPFWHRCFLIYLPQIREKMIQTPLLGKCLYFVVGTPKIRDEGAGKYFSKES